MSLSLGNTSRRSSVYMGSIALAFLALQGASDLVNNDQDYCGGLICQVAAMDATEIVSAPGSSKVTTGGPKGGRFLQRSGCKGSPQNNVSCSHGPDCNCDGLTNRRNLSANGGYYQCDSAKMLSDDDCIFTVTGSEPAAWSGKTVPHNIDRTVGTNHYRQIAKIDGTKYTAVTSVPWTNGDKLVKSKKALFGDIWHYTLAFEIIAPLRDKMMNDPSSLDSMAEWSKYTKSIKDCRVKIENYEYTDDGKTKIEYGLDDVHTVLKNANTQNVVAAEFVHHTILQFLEEAAIDLVCLMTEKLDSPRCTKIRTDIWGISKDSVAAFNCWQAGYKGLYDVDSALQKYFDGMFFTLDSWSVAFADSNWSKIKTKNGQKVSKPAKMQHTLRSWAWELADGTSAESLDKDSTFKTTVALMLCDRLSKASDKVDLGNCSDKTNKSVEVTRISAAAAAKKRLLLESSRSVLRRRLAASVALDVEYVVNIPNAEEASAALESAASDAGTFAKVDESFAAAKAASGLSEPLPAIPVSKQDFADKIAEPAFKDNAGNAVDASGNAIVENDGSSSDSSDDDSTVIIIVAAVAGVLLACGALVYKLKLSKSSAAHAKSQVTDNKSKTASIV